MNEELIKMIKALTEEIQGLKSALSLVKPVYTNAELGRLLDVSAKTIRKWREGGLLGYSKAGDTYLYSKEDVEAFLHGIHHSQHLIRIRH